MAEKLNIEVENKSLKDVFDILREKTKVWFVLEETKDVVPPVTFKTADTGLKDVLGQILKPLKLEFVEYEHSILVGTRPFLDKVQVDCIIYNLSDLSDAQIVGLREEVEKIIPKEQNSYHTPICRVAGKRLILTQSLDIHAAFSRSLEALRKKK